ncbi:hypothetical protein SAMN04489835_4449 [Mycolicibacterium rutilum]|uniref:Uncharacterized protein n=1 Tax=Mycolicibacterium rutilum TaxID=370526 RepID=A0A1H6LAH5_MYCRU|nr:hypothetical protein [Mycolicibacterium rutilum]SEH81308.1 hypothetical protein SAMN04489835_4449 [Mycolicibacterium rutilum]
MVTVPAVMWRGGFGRRALTIGGVVGSSLGVLAWLDSGFLVGGVIVTVVVGTCYGVWMARRMVRYWPQSETLEDDQRVAVVRAVRRGDDLDPGLSQAAAGYARALCGAAEEGRPVRWVLVVVLVVALGTAVWDATFGSWGSAIASLVYLAALLVEVFWWPRRRAHLLTRARSLAS